jgi:hypothetical protein
MHYYLSIELVFFEFSDIKVSSDSISQLPSPLLDTHHPVPFIYIASTAVEFRVNKDP